MHPTTTEPTALRCESCGVLVPRLITVQHTVRSLSLGKEVKAGDLICERCLRKLQEEFTEEELTRGPA